MKKSNFLEEVSSMQPLLRGLRELFVLCICLFLFTGYASANDFVASEPVFNEQSNAMTIRGQVQDSRGVPIPGVTVMVKGTTLGSATDMDGNYVLSVPSNSKVLLFSFIGFEVIEEPIDGRTTINAVLKESDLQLDEVVAVGYGAQKKVTVTGAISQIGGDDLVKTPTGSVTNALSGAVTGLSSVQFSGEPGADASQLYIRGVATMNNSSPLVQVDGVERQFSQIDPNEIESITVLKDASATAVFGVRGANGVILITTKRGKEGDAKVSFSTSTGFQVPTNLLDQANSYQYATYFNEAQTNDGVAESSLKFKPNVMEAFRTHSDPILYPDVDWFDYMLKGSAIQSQHNINVSGGAEKVRYFVSVGAFNQNGLFKDFGLDSDSNYKFSRYNYRANLDYDLSKSTLLSLNLGGRIQNKNTPRSAEGDGQLFRQIYWATPMGGAGIVDGKRVVTNPDYIPDPGIDGLQSFYGLGYKAVSTNVLNVDLSLNQKLDFITKGLSMKVKGSYNSSYYQTKQRASTQPYYTPVINESNGIDYMKSGDDGELGYSEWYGYDRNWYAEIGINYKRKFNEHTVTGLVLYNQSKTYYPATYSDIPSGYVGLVGRVTYDYKTKYMADLNMGYNGSENFAPGNRFGFFPAGSLGWIASEESFFGSIKHVVNYMKLRASFGVVGNDKYGNNRFLYLPDTYAFGGGYNFGTNISTNQSGAYEGAKSNQDLTWEKAIKQNYGIDLAFFRERLSFSADYFTENRDGILISPETIPGIIGVTMPALNLGEVENKGYEFSLKWNDQVGKNFRYWAGVNLSYSRNKIIEKGEVPPNEDYMVETGNPIWSRFAYQFWGFYDETANDRYKEEFGTDIATHSVNLEPGDAVYKDLNNDGVINGDDITKTGYTDLPEYTVGINAGFKWKNVDLSMQWTGAWNVDRVLQEVLRYPLGETQNRGLFTYQFENRWTPETSATATLPRPSFSHRANNTLNSKLFIVDSSYLRLKTLEIGYNFNFVALKNAGISKLRVYTSGYNLLTFSSFNYGDPESRTSNRPEYPLTRVFNFGLNVTF